jgi:predicted transcriptional regulator
MGKRKESLTLEEQERAKVLRAANQTFHKIALTLGRSPHTIKKFLIEPEVVPEVQRVKKELADMFEDVSVRMLTSITDEKIDRLNPLQCTTAAAIATDKMRLLRNQSTERIDVFALTADLTKLQQERERLQGLLFAKRARSGIKSIPDEGSAYE